MRVRARAVFVLMCGGSRILDFDTCALMRSSHVWCLFCVKSSLADAPRCPLPWKQSRPKSNKNDHRHHKWLSPPRFGRRSRASRSLRNHGKQAATNTRKYQGCVANERLPGLERDPRFHAWAVRRQAERPQRTQPTGEYPPDVNSHQLCQDRTGRYGSTPHNRIQTRKDHTLKKNAGAICLHEGNRRVLDSKASGGAYRGPADTSNHKRQMKVRLNKPSNGLGKDWVSVSPVTPSWQLMDRLFLWCKGAEPAGVLQDVGDLRGVASLDMDRTSIPAVGDG